MSYTAEVYSKLQELVTLHPPPWYLEKANNQGVEVKDNHGITVYYDDFGSIPDEIRSSESVKIRDASLKLAFFLVAISSTSKETVTPQIDNNERHCLKAELEKADNQLEKAQAACAQYRETLIESGCEEVSGVLSSDVGTVFLARLQKAEAACAEMRGALEKWKAYWQTTETGLMVDSEQKGEDFTDAWFEMEKALSTDCGTALLERLKELESETRFLADSIDRRDDKIRVLDSKLHARDAALAAARAALSLAAGISAVRSDKKLDHQIKEAKEASASAIEQIDAGGLPEKAKLTQTP